MANSGFQELLEEFLLEARERADEVEGLMLRISDGDPETRRTAMAQAKRELHTLKGNSGMMGFTELQQLAHQLEDEVESLDLEHPRLVDILGGLDTLRHGLEEISTAGDDAPAGGEAAGGKTEPGTAKVASITESSLGSVRVPFAKIEELVEIQAETLIFRNRLADAVTRGLALADDAARHDPEELLARLGASWDAVEEARQALEKTLNSLQEHVTELGMVPLQGLFRSLGRIVHDESIREGKEVTFDVKGGETPIDKTLLEAASEVLGHLVRNAVIHGVEPPEERRRLGKPAQGRIRIRAALEGGEVRIDVSDDGAGIDLEALRKKAAAIAPELGHESAVSLLFTDGLSTRQDADIGAGRGVGLAAVKRGVESHGGRIEVHTERRQGSTFILRLPLTTSILRTLLLTVDGEEYALPLTAVVESQRLEGQKRHALNHAPVVPWRGQLIPLLDLGLAFGTAEEIREKGYFIVIDSNTRFRGLAIDDIVGIRDIVVKGLDPVVGQPTGISGSTILGDGRVIMILDPNALGTIPPFVGRGTAVS